nr:MAG TPA: hypothetical protein [Caudoviricetes sp.]
MMHHQALFACSQSPGGEDGASEDGERRAEGEVRAEDGGM